MNVRFSKHALRRMRERFSFSIQQLVEIIDRGLTQNSWKFTESNCRKIDGSVAGRPVRIIFAKGLFGDVEIVTVMWLSSQS